MPQLGKKRVMVRFFGTTCAPPNTLTPTTHTSHTLPLMSIESDIYVSLCMDFVLVELFNEWVYGLC